MRRSVDHYDSDGRLVTGYDYINQAWVRARSYLDCNHPAEGARVPGSDRLFEGCNCYGRQHRGETPPIGCRYMNPMSMPDFLLRWWQAYSEGLVDQRQLVILQSWTAAELLHA